MSRGYGFKTITEYNLAWHPELGGEYYDWLWLDGWTEEGYTYGLTMAVRMDMAAQVAGPENKDLPLIDCLVTSPEGVTHRAVRSFPVEEFRPEQPWGVTIGGNSCIGTLTPDGKPAGYRIKVDLDGVGIDVSARAVAIGVQFVEAEHGYTYYHPIKNIGVGWWPLVVRAEIEGTLTFHGARVGSARILAAKLAKMPPMGLAMLKQMVYEGLNASYETQILTEGYASTMLSQTEDHKEGVFSFLEKRPPVFKGR